jgi:hypothetical protein
LQAEEHATEVLPYEVNEELGTRVAVLDAIFLQDFICQLSTGFEGKFLREDKSIIAVEEYGRSLADDEM